MPESRSSKLNRLLRVLLGLRELLPSVAESLSPGDDPSGPDLGRLGVSSDDLREFALGGLTRRLEIIGVPIATL